MRFENRKGSNATASWPSIVAITWGDFLTSKSERKSSSSALRFLWSFSTRTRARNWRTKTGRIKIWRKSYTICKSLHDEIAMLTIIELGKNESCSKSRVNTEKMIAPNLSIDQTIQISSSTWHSAATPISKMKEQIPTVKLKAVSAENILSRAM